MPRGILYFVSLGSWASWPTCLLLTDMPPLAFSARLKTKEYNIALSRRGSNHVYHSFGLAATNSEEILSIPSCKLTSLYCICMPYYVRGRFVRTSVGRCPTKRHFNRLLGTSFLLMLTRVGRRLRFNVARTSLPARSSSFLAIESRCLFEALDTSVEVVLVLWLLVLLTSVAGGVGLLLMQ